jgi:hypothetical protein
VTDSHNEDARFLFDSGYTETQLDRVFRSLVWGADLGPLEHYMSMMVIGLSDGDMERIEEDGS